MTDLPEEDIRQVEIGELGKIVERGREYEEQVEQEQNHRAPQQFHFMSRSVHTTIGETELALSANDKTLAQSERKLQYRKFSFQSSTAELGL